MLDQECGICKSKWSANEVLSCPVCLDKKELIEKLADIEHQRWSNWMQYVFSVSLVSDEGHLKTGPLYANRWRRQMNTPYSELTEEETQSDRNQVLHDHPAIEEHLSKHRS